MRRPKAAHWTGPRTGTSRTRILKLPRNLATRSGRPDMWPGCQRYPAVDQRLLPLHAHFRRDADWVRHVRKKSSPLHPPAAIGPANGVACSMARCIAAVARNVRHGRPHSASPASPIRRTNSTPRYVSLEWQQRAWPCCLPGKALAGLGPRRSSGESNS